MLAGSDDEYESGDTEISRNARDLAQYLSSSGFTVSTAWAAMVTYAAGIEAAEYDYELPFATDDRIHVANSNAVVFSVLNQVNVDARQVGDLGSGGDYSAGLPGAAPPEGAYTSIPTLLGSDSGPDPERIVASGKLIAGVAILGRDGRDDYMIGTVHPDAFYGEQGGPGTSVDTVSYEPSLDPLLPGAPRPSEGAVTVTLRDDATGAGFDGAAGDTYLADIRDTLPNQPSRRVPRCIDRRPIARCRRGLPGLAPDGQPSRNRGLDLGQCCLRGRAVGGAVGQVRDVGDPASVLFRPKQVDVVAMGHGSGLQLQAVALDQGHELLDLVRLGLAVRPGLQIE